MEPIAIVTAFVGVLYIVGRIGHVVAPRASVFASGKEGEAGHPRMVLSLGRMPNIAGI